MEYSIIRIGGKQFTVSKGTKIKLERQEKALAEVILYSDGETVLIGDPVLTDYSVDLERVEDTRARKVRVARYKSKSRYRKVNGHRQPITIFEVKDVVKGKVKAKAVEVKEEVKEKKVPVKKVTKEKKTPVKKVPAKKKETSKKVEAASKKKGTSKKTDK